MEIKQLLREGGDEPHCISEIKLVLSYSEKNQEELERGCSESTDNLLLVSQLALQRLFSLPELKDGGSCSKWKVALKGKMVNIAKYSKVLRLPHLTLLETSFMNKARNSSGAPASLRQKRFSV